MTVTALASAVVGSVSVGLASSSTSQVAQALQSGAQPAVPAPPHRVGSGTEPHTCRHCFAAGIAAQAGVPTSRVAVTASAAAGRRSRALLQQPRGAARALADASTSFTYNVSGFGTGSSGVTAASSVAGSLTAAFTALATSTAGQLAAALLVAGVTPSAVAVAAPPVVSTTLNVAMSAAAGVSSTSTLAAAAAAVAQAASAPPAGAAPSSPSVKQLVDLGLEVGVNVAGGTAICVAALFAWRARGRLPLRLASRDCALLTKNPQPSPQRPRLGTCGGGLRPG